MRIGEIMRLVWEDGGPLRSGVEAWDVVQRGVRVIFHACEVHVLEYSAGPKFQVKRRWTWPGVVRPSGLGRSHGRWTWLTIGRANHNCQQAPAINQVQRSAALA